MYRIFGILALTLLISCDSQGQHMQQADATKDKSANYGIVIGDVVGVVESINFADTKLEINYQVSGTKQVLNLSKSADTKNWKSSNTDKLSLTFNEDGTAKGKTEDGKNVFILIGEKSTDNKVIADLSKKGLRNMSMDLVIKNKLPGHDAPTWFYYQSDDYLQISYVFPVGFVHPSYGAQDHVRIFKYEKKNGKWKVREDNTSVQL